MSDNDLGLEERFPIGTEVRVKWRGQPTRGRVYRISPERANRNGTIGALLIRLGDHSTQTATFYPPDEVELL
jgi:hypothetical protein